MPKFLTQATQAFCLVKRKKEYFWGTDTLWNTKRIKYTITQLKGVANFMTFMQIRRK